MTKPHRSSFVTCAHPGGLHALAYRQWGDPSNPSVVVCVHGMSRNARDFDALAARLSARHRVICPDMPGRGQSDWLPDPNLYALPQYLADCVTLIARLDVESVAWVGTSMGGLIGMALASLDRTPVNRLVMNDIGPELNVDGIRRIAAYVGSDPTFPTEETARAYAKNLIKAWGPHSDEEWRIVTEHYVVPRDGVWKLHYDPAIAVPFVEGAKTAPPPLWSFYDRVACPTLVIHGATSDILVASTARAMTERGPRAQLVTIPGVGHAPGLVREEQLELVERFLAPSP
jgi:pimeloyl-ACP methyl ester carboxylesterase